MRFTPLTDEEIETQRRQLELGESDFEILEADAQTSKAGNDMIVLKINIYDKKGSSGIVYDYLIMYEENGTVPKDKIAFAHWKTKSVCKSIGKEENYNKGDLEPYMFPGQAGKCITKMQKDKTGKYHDKVVIDEYLPTENPKKIEPAKNITLDNKKEEDEPFDDDIPF